jgi:UDP-N-acetylmuramoyl-tripeptide--D-alanyl-D-alanine ligase
MMLRTLAAVAAEIQGTLVGDDAPFTDVSIDTRRLSRGSLFVAIRGERVDGSEFLGAALAQGASGALVSKYLSQHPISQVCVADTRVALGRMAQAWRANFRLPVVAVTGSNGKTTVKELVAAILRVSRKVCVTEGNLNNDLGVPLTLMRLADDDQALVVEMGANRAGDIDYLSALAQPEVGVITNANPAHLEGFGSIEGVARTKGELLDHLPPTGTAVLNADDPFYSAWAARSRAGRVVSFGLSAAADCSLIGEPEPLAQGYRFKLRLPDAVQLEVELPLLGRHNIANALAAAAAARAVGASDHDIVTGLALARPVPGRLVRLAGLRGASIIDDSYNANPASVRAALDHLAQQPGRRVFVLGEMAELGDQAVAMHREIGRYAASRIDALIAVGPLAAEAARSYGAAAQHFSDADSATEAAQRECGPDVTILVKGSRVSRLDRVVAALRDASEAVAC